MDIDDAVTEDAAGAPATALIPGACPSRDELAAFRSSGLSSQRTTQIAGHLAQCEPCQTASQTFEDTDRGTPAAPGSALVTSDIEPDSTAKDATIDRPIKGRAAGTIIGGRYKLIEPIGDGGMGAVWLAQQFEPLQRLVAVKLIKEGMDTRQVLARFEAERQALALMDHPNIAKVLDAGVSASGRPFFVMELVKGSPITQYCDERRLKTRTRLELFIHVCRAIQHAHQKGIIHRDIKPGNVLVADFDSRPVVKVIDFGIAKAIGQPLTERTLVTTVGAVVGTLEYMSPEQAELNQLDIDTRSDVYALGVLLYELLTGTTPLERGRIKRAALMEMLRLVREEEPPHPSNRLSSSDSLPSLAANRGTEPSQLALLIRGDLDWIAMRALEKDRTRRYETVNALARDVERHLADEPVEACPPTLHYRLTKFARRHRGPLRVAAIVGMLLVVATGVSVWQAVRATSAERLAVKRARETGRERDQKQTALVQVEEQQKKTKEALDRVREEQAKTKEELATREAVQTFFLEKVFAAGRPERLEGGLGRTVTLRRAIDESVPGIAASFLKRPVVEAAIRQVLGETYYYLGEPKLSIEQMERAVDLRRTHLGPKHPDTLASINNLGPAYLVVGRTKEAARLLEEALEADRATLGPNHPETLGCLQNLASAYLLGGRPADAARTYEEVLSKLRATSEPHNPHLLMCMSNLASTYQRIGRAADAARLQEESLAIQRAKLGPDHVDTLAGMTQLALVYRDLGRLEEAIALAEQALAARRAKLGPDHPETLKGMNVLTEIYLDSGRSGDALRLAEEAVAGLPKKFGADDLNTFAGQYNLARAYRKAGRTEDAIRLGQATLAAAQTKFGPDHGHSRAYQSRLAMSYLASGQPAEALPLLEEALPSLRASLGGDHLVALECLGNLAKVELAGGRPEKARPLFVEFLAGERNRVGKESFRYAKDLASVGSALVDQKQFVDAEPLLRERLAIETKTRPDHWTKFDAQSRLGEALAGRGAYADAEPLLRSGYEGMKALQAKIPPDDATRPAEAAESVARLYEAWGKPDEAARWRATAKNARAEAPFDQ
jgi:eukaryotic-like serine/threonine-protein kinase